MLAASFFTFCHITGGKRPIALNLRGVSDVLNRCPNCFPHAEEAIDDVPKQPETTEHFRLPSYSISSNSSLSALLVAMPSLKCLRHTETYWSFPPTLIWAPSLTTLPLESRRKTIVAFRPQ